MLKAQFEIRRQQIRQFRLAPPPILIANSRPPELDTNEAKFFVKKMKALAKEISERKANRQKEILKKL
jgi:hypothetical protein